MWHGSDSHTSKSNAFSHLGFWKGRFCQTLMSLRCGPACGYCIIASHSIKFDFSFTNGHSTFQINNLQQDGYLLSMWLKKLPNSKIKLAAQTLDAKQTWKMSAVNNLQNMPIKQKIVVQILWLLNKHKHMQPKWSYVKKCCVWILSLT